MDIIIVGCGKVGSTLVEQLSDENHNITVIDKDAAKVGRITNSYDIMGFVGDGTSYSLQMNAGVENADLLIAVTGSDELNLLCCLFAKKAGNCRTIARVRNPLYNKDLHYIKEELGLSMVINPEYAAAMEIARLLRFPSANKIDTFAKGRVEMARFKVQPEHKICGNSLSQIRTQYKCDLLICAVERKGEVCIPDGNFVIEPDDIISVIATPVNSNYFFEKIGADTHKVKDAMIIGGGTITYYLGAQLQNMGIKLRIVESNLQRCEELSDLLPKTMIINGDGTNKELLLEEGLANTEAFVALTNIDEENILLALYARKQSRAKSIVKIDRSSFDEVIRELDVGSIIDPKYITANYIIRYVRGMRKNSTENSIETLYKILDGRAEAVEFLIEPDCPLIGQKLKNLQTKDNLLIGCITRKRRVLIPGGDDSFQPDDSVIVVTTHTGLKEITDILRR